MCKNLRNMALVEPVDLDCYCPKSDDLRPVMDDVSAFETLCPVSPITGHRSNPLDAIDMMLKPDKARLLNQVLQEIPPSGVPSDTGTFEFIADRLSLGTDAERARYIKLLENNAESIFNIRPDLRPKDTIEFSRTDEESVDKSE